MSEISTKLEAAGLRVTPLEWEESLSPREDGPAEPTGGWTAYCYFGEYSVDFDSDDEMAAYPWCVWAPDGSLGHFAEVDEAQAAAEADYTSRILAALEAAP